MDAGGHALISLPGASWRRSDAIEQPYCRRMRERLPNTRVFASTRGPPPGHQGGIAFTKIPAGRAFFDFYGENLFRTDMGIERGQLGSLLDHTGPVLHSERYAARVFGAHRSYSGVSEPRAPIEPSCRPA